MLFIETKDSDIWNISGVETIFQGFNWDGEDSYRLIFTFSDGARIAYYETKHDREDDFEKVKELCRNERGTYLKLKGNSDQ